VLKMEGADLRFLIWMGIILATVIITIATITYIVFIGYPEANGNLKTECIEVCAEKNLEYSSSSIGSHNSCTCKNTSMSGWIEESPYKKFVNYDIKR